MTWTRGDFTNSKDKPKGAPTPAESAGKASLRRIKNLDMWSITNVVVITHGILEINAAPQTPLVERRATQRYHPQQDGILQAWLGTLTARRLDSVQRRLRHEDRLRLR
ncbi:hypothetical protein EVAR_70883_1 [Eumeta japonica]|uniref:Uncharacterized protein n=1 Tax=Eumeta variegata TaxID=151549 RepID=A0A4C2AGI2_EUMVA|nr:hypothetical protein EVAR_70883_1 [Eumeta japonica]